MSAVVPLAARPGLLRDARRIAALAWPLFFGQLAVLAFSTVDTVMTARHSAVDLAALAVGGAVYISVFVGFMGVVLAVGPIAGQLFGAGKLIDAGRQLHQAMWLALGLSVLGCSLLLFPQPFLVLSHAEGQVADKVRDYLFALAFALPSALLFTAFRGFNTAVSRPKIVMALQFGALLLKVPLNALLVFGFEARAISIPAFGAAGCGIATAIVMGVQLVAAWTLLRRDPLYRRFGLHERHISPPDRASLAGLLRLGIPMGLSIGIEVTGFTFMAFFIARLGATPVAGHQIAVNIVSVLFMMPLALANATSTLVAQRLGAEDWRDARRIGWHGLQLAVAIAAAMGAAVYLTREGLMRAYTHDTVIIAAAMPLLAWVMLFHIADAAQTVASFTLRAYKIATVPVIIYASAIWGVGLGGGYLVAFDVAGLTPDWLLGAPGFWAASTAGLTVAAVALVGFLTWTLKALKHA
ncbi:MATE family efflux transporter [Piscinibacter sp. XHJ-5]|uniref:MATE family efflux transporter n=1 Tax=Piscinibacter sp. XHJ-5 TaxID=3037797 RepID=UPI002452B9D6|nr:MATE family efflux transporter [Piscinibacter sp. XHJ-5]